MLHALNCPLWFFRQFPVFKDQHTWTLKKDNCVTKIIKNKYNSPLNTRKEVKQTISHNIFKLSCNQGNKKTEITHETCEYIFRKFN